MTTRLYICEYGREGAICRLRIVAGYDATKRILARMVRRCAVKRVDTGAIVGGNERDAGGCWRWHLDAEAAK